MPNALPEEGTTMRVQAITAVNTQQQPNPFFMQSASNATAGKISSLISFEECLKSQIQNNRAPAMTQKAEVLAVSSLSGYLVPQSLLQKPELKPKARAYASLSDL